MHVFVTGASGKLGSRVTSLLLARGDTVSGLARSTASANVVEKLRATPVQGVWTQLDLLRSESAKADAVIHCAFNHDDMQTGYAKVCEDDRNAIQAMVEGLNSNRAGKVKVFIYISGTFGGLGPDEESPKQENEHMPRYKSEDLTTSLTSSDLRTVIVRLPPVVHDEALLHPFLEGMAAAAKKSGFSSYVNEKDTWPSAHYDDVADLCVLALDKAPTGKALHAIAEPAVSTKDMAEWIGEELALPVKTIPAEDAMGHFGFVGMLLGMPSFTTAEKTKAWTGWNPTRPGLMQDMRKRGLGGVQVDVVGLANGLSSRD